MPRRTPLSGTLPWRFRSENGQPHLVRRVFRLPETPPSVLRPSASSRRPVCRASRNSAPRASPHPRIAKFRVSPHPRNAASCATKYIRQSRRCQPVILCRIRTDFSFFHRRQVASALTRRGASCIHRIFRAVHISSSCTDSLYPPFESSGNVIQIYLLRIKRPKAFARSFGRFSRY